jgi:Arc/MetJ family transcription regulator
MPPTPAQRRARTTAPRWLLPDDWNHGIEGDRIDLVANLVAEVYRDATRRCIIVDVSHTTIKRTNINLDTELVDAAAEVLGTVRTTDTVHAALRSVIAHAARERLTHRDFEDLAPDLLDKLRAPRRHP